MTLRKLILSLSIISVITFAFLILFTTLPKTRSFFDDNTVKDTVRFETLKSLLQLLVVIVIGGVVTMLFKASETNSEQLRIKRETWKDYLKRIGSTYQQVKRARRSLTSEGLTQRYNSTPDILLNKEQVDHYVAQMQNLNNAQIELEGLKTEAENLPEFISLSGITNDLKNAEDYLRQIVKEYEKILPEIRAGRSIQFQLLERLREFTMSTSAPFSFWKQDETDKYRFNTHFAASFRNIVKVFNEAFK